MMNHKNKVNSNSAMAACEAEFLKSYDSYADAIFRHCYFRVYERERAKELAQEAFMRTWEYIAKGNEVKNIRAFLYRVANNLIIDESRKTKPVSLNAMTENGFDAADPSASEEQLSTVMEAQNVVAQMKRLEPMYRDVFIMRYVDGFKPKEIAKIIGESENVVSVRLHRALKQISNVYHDKK